MTERQYPWGMAAEPPLTDGEPATEPALARERVHQKARTRQALVDTLRRLLADGDDPSVAEVAAAAGVSRTTAYRYFPDQLSLLQAALPETGLTSLLGAEPPEGTLDTDPLARLEVALERHFAFISQWEPQLRAALRVSLAPQAGQPLLRGGRAVQWYADALAPLAADRPDLDLRALAVRIRAAAGIEPFVWLTGVERLDADAAFQVMRDNALAIAHRALEAAREPTAEPTAGY